MTKKSGLDFLNAMDSEASEAMAQMSARFPELGNAFIERLYGDAYQRDQLSLRERLLVTAAFLMPSPGMQPQLVGQLRLALKNGVSREELMEVAHQFSVFYGFPAALGALHIIDGVADEVEIASAESVGHQQ